MSKENEFYRDFPLLLQDRTVYLDSAATAQRPACVLEAERDFYVRSNANPLRGLYELSVDATERYEHARRTVQKFLNAAHPEEIVFTRNTTESLNLVAYSWGLSQLRAGDEVVVSISEHHSNLLPWQMVCRQTGAVLKFLECASDGSYSDETLEAAIGPKTKLVALAQVSNVFGRENPVREAAALAHRYGAVMVVDGAQSAPHMPVDVQELDADFFALSGHKLYGPMGIGVLYGKRELLEKMPPFLTGGEMIETVTRTGATWAELPHKFEAGTVNAAGAVGLEAAVQYIQRIGWETITEREERLTALGLEGLKKIPCVHVLGSDKPEEHHGILTFTLDGVHPHDIASILDGDGIAVRAGHHCAQPLMEFLGVQSTTRASLAFYNTEEDVRKFLDSLSQVRGKMGYGT